MKSEGLKKQSIPKRPGPLQAEVDAIFANLRSRKIDLQSALIAFQEIIAKLELGSPSKAGSSYDNALIGFMQCAKELKRADLRRFITEKINSSSKTIHVLNQHAEYLAEIGDYAGANALYQAETDKDKDPKYEPIYINYAKFCIEQMKKSQSEAAALALYNKAKQLFERALEKFGENRERKEVILQQYIICLTAQCKNSKEACAVLEKQYSLQEMDSCRNCILLIACARALEDADRIMPDEGAGYCAVSIYEKILALDSNHLDAWCGLIMCYQKIGDFTEGENIIENVPKKFSKVPRFLNTVSRFYQEVPAPGQGNSMRISKQYAQQAKAIDPSYTPALSALGHIKDHSGHYKTAEAVRAQRHALDPSHMNRYRPKLPSSKLIVEGATSSSSSSLKSRDFNVHNEPSALDATGCIPGYTPLPPKRTEKKGEEPSVSTGLSFFVPQIPDDSKARKRIRKKREKDKESSAAFNNMLQMQESAEEIPAKPNIPQTAPAFTTAQCLSVLGVFAFVAAATVAWLGSSSTEDAENLSEEIGNMSMSLKF